MSLMFCSGARLILVVVCLVSLFSSASQYIWAKGLPSGDGGAPTWECFVMPIVMESSMFSYSIGKSISNHIDVGFNFVKVYGRV